MILTSLLKRLVTVTVIAVVIVITNIMIIIITIIFTITIFILIAFVVIVLIILGPIGFVNVVIVGSLIARTATKLSTRTQERGQALRLHQRLS